MVFQAIELIIQIANKIAAINKTNGKTSVIVSPIVEIKLSMKFVGRVIIF